MVSVPTSPARKPQQMLSGQSATAHLGAVPHMRDRLNGWMAFCMLSFRQQANSGCGFGHNGITTAPVRVTGGSKERLEEARPSGEDTNG